MAIVKEKHEHTVVTEVDECRCDQCGKQMALDETRGYPEFPAGWLIVRTVGAPLKPPGLYAQVDSFCSWVCLSTYAATKTQGRIAVSV